MRVSLPLLAALSLVAAPLAVLACRIPPEPASGVPVSLSTPGHEERVARGAELYGVHCAVCHGPEGRGDGPAGAHLFPPARDFASARFRLVSSDNGVPFDRDLVATLRRGAPGSAMPAFGWLPEQDLWSLAAYVRTLAFEGLHADLAAEGRRKQDAYLIAGAERIARERTTPGRTLARTGEVDESADSLARGARIFAAQCALCHADDGTGVPEPRRDEDGTLNWARDLTAGFLKGGDSPSELGYRIRAGMPGTAMPPTDLEPADERALIAFLRTLIPEGTAERLVHRRETLVARRVEHAPDDVDDAAWRGADELEVVLAPLWWNAEAVHEAKLAALHDGRDVALRLTWEDATGELHVFSEAGTSDAAALQLSDASEPALFGMGSPEHRTNLWHWQALRLDELAGAVDLLDPTPHAGNPTIPGSVQVDVPLYRRLLSRVPPSERVDRITAVGVPSVAPARRRTGEVLSHARWEDGTWSVVFRRPLVTADEEHVSLVPGEPVQVACAVWNGAVGDHGARKSISIWQELVLEP